MIMFILAVRDAKSDMFGQPFCQQSIGAGMRSFEDEVNRNDENNMMFRHPEDFSLWQIGTYDNGDATIAPIQPKLLIQADQVKRGMLEVMSKV